ncbi:MAG: hypothetical protein QXP69_01505 [Candidatus Nitrosocaldus sp.]
MRIGSKYSISKGEDSITIVRMMHGEEEYKSSVRVVDGMVWYDIISSYALL